MPAGVCQGSALACVCHLPLLRPARLHLHVRYRDLWPAVAGVRTVSGDPAVSSAVWSRWLGLAGVLGGRTRTTYWERARRSGR